MAHPWGSAGGVVVPGSCDEHILLLRTIDTPSRYIKYHHAAAVMVDGFLQDRVHVDASTGLSRSRCAMLSRTRLFAPWRRQM